MKGLHFGQRKLLLSEIEFIVEYVLPSVSSGKPPLIVYAGAANGSHLPILFQLLPMVRWILVDPAPFCEAVHEVFRGRTESDEPKAKRQRCETDSVIMELLNECCTDELCIRLRKRWGGEYALFLVSDIRLGDPSKKNGNFEVTKLIEFDNQLQLGFCYALQCEKAMLKFHPPYPRDEADERDKTPDEVRYLDGDLLLGVWAPKSSTEVRLVPKGPFLRPGEAAERSYDLREFEEQMYYYNTTNRYAADVAAEKMILTSLAKQMDSSSTGEDLSARISEFLGFPLFRPLASDCDEDAARLIALLYDARRIDLLPHLREKISLLQVRKEYAARVESATTSSEIPAEFWAVANAKRLAAFYSVQPPPFIKPRK